MTAYFLMSQVRAIRNIRAEYSVEPAKRISASVVASNEVIEYIAVSVVYSSFLRPLIIKRRTNYPSFLLIASFKPQYDFFFFKYKPAKYSCYFSLFISLQITLPAPLLEASIDF